MFLLLLWFSNVGGLRSVCGDKDTSNCSSSESNITTQPLCVGAFEVGWSKRVWKGAVTKLPLQASPYHSSKNHQSSSVCVFNGQADNSIISPPIHVTECKVLGAPLTTILPRFLTTLDAAAYSVHLDDIDRVPEKYWILQVPGIISSHPLSWLTVASL